MAPFSSSNLQRKVREKNYIFKHIFFVSKENENACFARLPLECIKGAPLKIYVGPFQIQIKDFI